MSTNSVQCDRCHKWRKLAPHVAADSLPDEWFCEMNTWDSRYASCQLPEEPEEVLVPAPAYSFIPNSSGKMIAQKRPSVKITIAGETISGGSSRSSQPHHDGREAKRLKITFDGNKESVSERLKTLARTLYQTMETVSNFSSKEDEATLFSQINDIIIQTGQVSKSASDPISERDKKILECFIPDGLLDILDRPDLNNAPSVYTRMVLGTAVSENELMINAAESFKNLYSELTNETSNVLNGTANGDSKT